MKLTWKTGNWQKTAKIFVAALAVQGLLFILFFGNDNPSNRVYIEEEAKSVLLKSVFNSGNIDDYKISFLSPFETINFPDGVYWIAITTGAAEAKEITANCVLVRDVVGYKEGSYSLGMFDCDKYPEFDPKRNRVEITAISQGDLLDSVGRGFYKLVLPGNVIPGRVEPTNCFVVAQIEGAMGIVNGYSGMSCDFQHKES